MILLSAAVLLSWGVGLAAMDPGGVPHYFGPYPNWAYSPLPTGAVTSVTLTDGGSGYTVPTVTISDLYGTGSGATATATIDATGAISAILFDPAVNGGAGYSAPVVIISDPDPNAAGATATAAIGGIGVPLTGGIKKFVDNMALLTPAGINTLGQYIPLAAADNNTYPGSDYYEIALVEFNEKMHSSLPPSRHRGYVQLWTQALSDAGKVGVAIPLVNPDGTPIMMPDNVTQAIAVDNPHFLGPVIVAMGSIPGQPGRPVRLKFYNLLPTGAGGNLFLPVDPTVMGAGIGPKDALGNDCDPMMPPMPGMPACENYTQNRATVHLHGNNTVWISDGTTHQWTTPAGETSSSGGPTPYPRGVSARNVPDMDGGDPGPGALTFYYTNAQSARLMFYHDHAMGITRLNVYAGEAAGYVITDQVEQDLINGTNDSGVNPTGASVLPGIGIPLVIQDRTFVDNVTIAAQDPTWNWGTGPRDPATGKITAAVTGDLWYPHVYMPAQNPWNPDLSGMNPFGRWHYGPWFYPPTTFLAVGPVPNPYADPANPGYSPLEPPLMPGTPNPSMAGEAFMDTPVVNGTVYPYLEVEPKTYRFRILNAGDDRFLNLQLYVAADKISPTTAGTVGAVLCDGINTVPLDNCTEVAMIPVGGTPGIPADFPSGIPDPATKGPDWIQIGTEGGFLPAPVVIPSQPITWNLDPTAFNFGNVVDHSLLLGTAERADVIVDFSQFAGQTLILYNDAPAAFPARVSTYDYFTGAPDLTEIGGAPPTQPGYGPNTRTIMQIRVKASAPAAAYDVAALNAAFAKGPDPKRGVFEVSQDPIIMPQAFYNSAYGVTNLPVTPLDNAYVLGIDLEKTFRPIDANGVLQPLVTIPLEPKAMHDEMGGVYDTQFGRMSGMLGLQLPATQSRAEQFLAYGYASPPVDIVKGSVSGSLVGSLADGTQIWKITHNGVDSHTIHTHLFNGQLINRIAWDGHLLPPDLNELGWKDTFRVNPLEHTVIALRPIVPTPAQLPFEVSNSIRLIDPTLPPGAMLIPPPPAGWFDPLGNQINDADMVNHEVNFGWEYVWHCHILAHEEMDMMHSLAFAIPPATPPSISLPVTLIGNGNNRRVVLAWTDIVNATNFTVQRATNVSFTNNLLTVPLGKVTTYTNPIGSPNQTFYYRVFASNVVGDTAVYPGSPSGFPTETLSSASSNVAPYPATATLTPPAAPATVTAVYAPQGNNARVRLTWTNVANESGYRIQRALNAAFTSGAVTSTVGANVTTFTTGNLSHNVDYYFRVQAFNVADPSAWVNAAPFPIHTP